MPSTRPSLRMLLGPALLLIGVTVSSSAEAYQHVTCNGAAMRWATTTPSLQVDDCTVFGERWDALHEAVQAWNDIGGTDARIRLVEPGFCTRPRRDGVNAVSFVPGDAIDGALGLTVRYYSNACRPWLPHPTIVEADVSINADDPPLLDPDRGRCAAGERGRDCRRWEARPPCEIERGGTVRNTIIHELGHVFGLLHFDDDMAVMMTHNGEGRYCGARPWGPMPDDILAIRRIYGFAGPAVRELSVSGQRWVAPDLLHPVGVRRGAEQGPAARLPGGTAPARLACAGAPVPVQIGIANRGTLAGIYRVHWFASTDRALSPDDVRLGVTPWRAIASERFAALGSTARVSRWLDPQQAYHVLYLVEPSWGWAAERRQGDNVGILPGTLRRRPEGSCR